MKTFTFKVTVETYDDVNESSCVDIADNILSGLIEQADYRNLSPEQTFTKKISVSIDNLTLNHNF